MRRSSSSLRASRPDAALEAIDAGLPLVIVITEGIPTLQMMQVYWEARRRGTRLVGPNCPGLITPGAAKLGIMPGHIHKPGKVGLISRSGTLTYEFVAELTRGNYGADDLRRHRRRPHHRHQLCGPPSALQRRPRDRSRGS